MTAAHISSPTTHRHTNSPVFFDDTGADPDGICHCEPQPESSAIGECQRCHRLDIRKAFA